MYILKRKKLLFCFIGVLLICNFGIFYIFGGFFESTLKLEIDTVVQTPQNIQVAYGIEKENSSDNLKFMNFQISEKEKLSTIELKIPKDIKSLRLDYSDLVNETVKVDAIKVSVLNRSINISSVLENVMLENNMSAIGNASGEYKLTGEDPYIYLELSDNVLLEFYESTKTVRLLFSFILSLLVDVVAFILLIKATKSKEINDMLDNRGTIWNLAKRDFKTKYAGSYLGIFWAFVQPIVTILIYWFVFEVGFRSAPTNGFPFVLWLIAGIVPWFLFSDGITAITNCLLEYAFLVKKVVFNIKMLPIVKIISSLFVHLFFIGFSMFIFALNGFYPSLYSIQIIYYLFATIMLMLGIGLITASVIVFFRDLGQIVQICLQIGVWLTPIMWNLSIISPKLQAIFKFNPTYYIVEGYRDAFINHVWFWEKPQMTIYYWVVVLIILFIGMKVFNKLKSHFADVL